jgi:hypothetical protein
MMIEIGRYVLIGLIAIFAIGMAVLIGFMVRSSQQEKKAQQAGKETPRVDTLAEQIKNQFKVEEARKDRVIHTHSGIARTTLKQTSSAFKFKQDDADTGLSLESAFDNGPEASYIDPNDKL